MPLTLTQDERAALEAAQPGSQQVRHWRRYQAVLLRADGVPVAVVARTVGGTATSVSNWTAAWRQEGLAGVAEGQHPGAPRRFDAPADAAVEALLTEGDPQAHGYAATGWTVPRHAHRVGQAGLAGGRAHHPSHAAPLGLALETAQVRAGPARPGVRREKKPSPSRRPRRWRPVGRGWFGDETTRREFPPLRAGWARRGEQQVVVVSGRNSRRVVQGARHAATGALVALVRERRRQADCAACVEALGQVRPDVPTRLVWDTAPPHHPKRVQAAAPAAPITRAFLPFRAPEVLPCSAWRGSVAAGQGAGRRHPRLRTGPGAG